MTDKPTAKRVCIPNLIDSSLREHSATRAAINGPAQYALAAPPRHHDGADESLHGSIVLVERRRPHPDQSLPRLGPRRAHIQDLGLDTAMSPLGALSKPLVERIWKLESDGVGWHESLLIGFGFDPSTRDHGFISDLVDLDTAGEVPGVEPGRI